MSKKSTTQVGQLSYGYGYVVQENLPNYLRGRLFTIIEALGLRETQEKSLKDLVDVEIWSQFDVYKGSTLWIPGSLNDEIRRVMEKIEKEERSHTDNLVPTPVESPEGYKFTISYQKN